MDKEILSKWLSAGYIQDRFGFRGQKPREVGI